MKGKLNLVLVFLAGVLIVLEINAGNLTPEKMMNFATNGFVGENHVVIPGPPIKENPVAEPNPVITDKKAGLNILAFGDLMPGRYVRTLMDKNGKNYIFEKIGDLKNIFPEANLIFANLEGPIKGEGYKSQTSMVFGFNEDTAPFLKEKGFGVLSIANNHALDQRADGREATIKALSGQELGWCGNAKEADLESVYYGENNGEKFAFVCLNDVTFPLDENKAVELIKSVRPKVDFLIVSIHWGIEYTHSPSKKLQINPAHEFVDAGADFIIGHHPHVVQTLEIYNGKFIFYSLGNFVFDQYWSTETQKELAIKIALDKGKTAVTLVPMKSERSQPRILTGDEKTKWLEEFIKYGNYDENLKAQIRAGELSL